MILKYYAAKFFKNRYFSFFNNDFLIAKKNALICTMLIGTTLNLFSCSENTESAYYETIVYGNLPTGLIALTYDDGPGPGTLELAKYLHEQNISATFFVNAKRKYRDVQKGVDLYAGYEVYDLLDSLIKYGHRIGNHTANHLNLLELAKKNNYEQLTDQLLSNQRRINHVINNYLCYYRPPWGAWSEDVFNCVISNDSLAKLCGPVFWKYDSKDYIYGPKDALPEVCGEDFINEHIADFQNKVGGIMLMHDLDLYNEKDYSLRETKVVLAYLKKMGYVFVPPRLNFSQFIPYLCERESDFSDAEGWASSDGFYSTIHLADVNGDSKSDIVALGKAGIYVALSNGLKFGKATLWRNLNKTNSDWLPYRYDMCLQCGDINGDGKADIIIRGRNGISVSFSNGQSFTSFSLKSSFFSDSKGWGSNEAYYGSIRLADVDGDGKSDIIGRGPKGIYVSRSLGSTFSTPFLSNSKDFSDAAGWLSQRGLSIQCADVNADGKADIVYCKSSGIYVSLSKGSVYQKAELWTKLINTDCIAKLSDYTETLRLADVNGDKRADVIIRGAKGIYVALSTGNSFYKESLWTKSGFSDSEGWKPVCYSTTIQCGDINGDLRADIIGRCSHGITGVFAP